MMGNARVTCQSLRRTKVFINEFSPEPGLKEEVGPAIYCGWGLVFLRPPPALWVTGERCKVFQKKKKKRIRGYFIPEPTRGWWWYEDKER